MSTLWNSSNSVKGTRFDKFCKKQKKYDRSEFPDQKVD